uniref:Homeobox domain-containing protein n=1 Tax=Globodera rostochiensis TaxID=31243 RepID=A0A914H248_GLORO
MQNKMNTPSCVLSTFSFKLFLINEFLLLTLLFNNCAKAFDDEVEEWLHLNDDKSVDQIFSWNSKEPLGVDRDFFDAHERLPFYYFFGDQNNTANSSQSVQQATNTLGLETNRKYLQNQKKKYDKDFKLQKMCQYFEMKESSPTLKEKEISKMLEIPERTLSRWKMEFGPTKVQIDFTQKTTNRLYGIEEKRQKLREYYRLKESNPTLREFEFAKILNVSERSLCKWKKSLG